MMLTFFSCAKKKKRAHTHTHAAHTSGMRVHMRWCTMACGRGEVDGGGGVRDGGSPWVEMVMGVARVVGGWYILVGSCVAL